MAGESTMVYTVGNVQVWRRLDRVAYPNNGNAHNPTKYYMWDVVVEGAQHPLLSCLRTLSAMVRMTFGQKSRSSAKNTCKRR